MAVLIPVTGLLADDTSVLVGILVRKGILTEDEAQAVLAEAAQITGGVGEAPAVAAAEPAPDPEPEPEAKSKSTEKVLVSAASKIASSFKIGGRLQGQYAGLHTDIKDTGDDPDPTRHFFMRRVYVGASAKFGDQWSAKVTYDLASAGFDAAYLQYVVNDNNLINIGLRKVNFAYEETISSGSIPAIERSGVTRYFVEPYNGRRLGGGSYRVGLFYDGKAGNFFYGASVTNPERPRNAVDAAAQGDVFNNGLAFWGNVGYQTNFDGGGLIVGAGFGHMNDQGGIVGTGEDLTVGSVYTDTRLGDFRLIAEVLMSDAGDSKPWGYHVQPIYAFNQYIEGVARFSYTDSDGRGIRTSDGIRSAPSGGTMDKLYEGYLGANWFIKGNDLKLQGGVVLGKSKDGVDGSSAEATTFGIRSQMQVNF